MRVLCFLSADALTLLSQSRRYFSALCAEPVLWRRLFCYRWGKKNKQQNQLSWKVSAASCIFGSTCGYQTRSFGSSRRYPQCIVGVGQVHCNMVVKQRENSCA
jgi:hypothetical protein